MYPSAETNNHSGMELKPNEEINSRAERLCLIGKFVCGNLSFKESYVKSVTFIEWRCKKDYEVSHIKSNLFMFSFQSTEDFSKVLFNTPHTIRGFLLVLSPWISSKIPTELQFSFSPFWVQVHGLSFNYFTKVNLLKISELLGKPLHGDVLDGNLVWRKYLRIRVILDVRNPLLSGFWQKRCGLPDVWIDFKYEKLGLFCYKCGRIGYSYRDCKFAQGNGSFGPWMRADQPFTTRYCGDSRSTDGGLGGGASPRPSGELVVRDRRMVEQTRNRFASLATMDKITVFVPSAGGDQEISIIESEPMLHGVYNVPPSLLLQRVSMNTISAMIIIGNCQIICSRVVAANVWDNNWNLLALMTAYFMYLVINFVHILRTSWLSMPPHSDNASIRVKYHRNGRVTREILFLLLVFVMLKFC